MTNYEAIMKMAPDELALFLGKVFCQGEIYGELLRSDCYKRRVITSNDLSKAMVTGFTERYLNFLASKYCDGICDVPDIKY